MTEKEFIEKYCLLCGTQRCGGINDIPFRDGCEYYRQEYQCNNTGDDCEKDET